MSQTKQCRQCGQWLGTSCFDLKTNTEHGQRRGTCKACRKANKAARKQTAARWPSVAAFDNEPTVETELTPAERKAAERAERDRHEVQRRHQSDFAALNVDDFVNEYDTSVANVDSPNGRKDSATASREKRQEFNARMGNYASSLRDAAETAPSRGGELGSAMPDEHARYIQLLAEQERRFGNRRWARSVSIQAAHEQLTREGMVYVAETYFKDKVVPTGYARFAKPEKPMQRMACVLLSDIHLGSELDSFDEPVSYRAIEEARRLEFVLRQFIDFKPQYRDNTSALIIINGDIIEGMLLHDLRSGSPLTEQQAIFWHYFVAFIATVAAHFKAVHIECQSGNHGRNKLRHPGRATSSKWDGVEGSMYIALKMMCSGLKNVTWSIPFQAVGIVDIFGQKLGVTHADTELKLGDPDTKSKENAASLDKVNATRVYGCEFDAFTFGHYHKPRYQPRNPRVLWNGALVPPNGHARTSGYIGEPCGQWIWEAVPGHIFGDLRFIEVGQSQDYDEKLGTIIKPFRFSLAA